MLEFFKKNWKIIVFAAVVAIAIFLRVYHFHDWLFFKMDQARDAFTAQQAYLNGPGWLPLLGPKAGGTKVNLGPIFYYFQYFSAVIFHSVSPSVLAYPDLLFSILSIPLLYLFLKKFFSRDWSMILAGLYALCFLGIEYSRFAWNPNSLPFFNLLFFYALLNIFDPRYKFKLRWYILAGLAFAISTQLHFLSFFTLPLLALIFLIVNRKEVRNVIDWKKTLIFLVIILIIYSPVFFHEFHTNFRNSKAFLDALHSKASNHGILNNIQKDIAYFGINWTTILTGIIFTKKSSAFAPYMVWFLFFLPGLFLNWRYFKKEQDPLRKKFMLITLIWLPIYFLGYIPIAYQIRPRFFLPMLPLPFIFLGYICFYLASKKEVWLKYFPAILVAVVLIGNSYGTYAWFKEMKDAQKKGIYPKLTIILKAKDGIVLWHLENAEKYIHEDCKANTAYYYSSNEYKRPIEYLLGLQGIRGTIIDSLYSGQRDCVYGVLLTRSAKTKLPAKITDKFDRIDSKKFGAITIYKLSAKDEFVGQPLGYTNKPLPEASLESGRIFWKDILSK